MVNTKTVLKREDKQKGREKEGWGEEKKNTKECKEVYDFSDAVGKKWALLPKKERLWNELGWREN